ncbi:MAG TPA: IS200/IS605 family transposase [Pyrinomonadaceae bacterium]|nr:IS200/IS605 family transposase [Pyrinomonadaceae bacterium]
MSQTLVSLLVHVVFSTKDRADLITPELEPDLFAYLSGILNNHESRCLAVGGTANHVHLLVSLSKNFALSEVVGDLKRSSSRWVKTNGARFRDFGWQDGYGAFSIGESNVEALKGYIARQGEHHRRRTFESEMLSLLKRYGVKYEEEYLWR